MSLSTPTLTLKRHLLVGAVMTATLVASSTTLAATTMRIAHLNPPDPTASNSGAMTAVFKQLVETATNGEIKVEVFPAGQLGEDANVINQVGQGIVQSTISSAGGVAEHYPRIGIFDIPFAFPNIAVATEVIDLESDFGQALADDLEAETDGLKVLGLLDSGGFFQFTNSQRPIETTADMEGLRIRTMTLPTHEAMINALGAEATPLAWSEVYTALQTGVADGQMNPIQQTSFANFDEVQSYLTVSNHLITPYVWLINEDFYNGLSAEQQTVVDWAADVAVDAGRSMSRIIEASDNGLPKLAEGMEVNAITPEARQAFVEMAQPAVRQVIAERYGSEGEALLASMLDAIDSASTP
ncbi:DctP family TRAP transporter solute-binding subunit [Halomonas sp. DP8Y7-1]|uniref:TRAP transporter substrate-binding protein n=1 Tax=unclassified Halomonas TaxID=2609666 RepID=UPI001C958E29|nr:MULTISPECIES: DctP family TRAP transporter solute-binding subunit [unclassified Halomonas]MBY5928744.1 DctP family TRAP transporter solute-binding subunit [Halomonas sp. DP8Y7-3]MBY6031093.1 DctP family TRAP transporter solute-binding subunit [Halomonas sp. DP8Y7-1]